MPIRHAIWTVGGKPKALPVTALPSEKQLEDMITSDPSILSEEWMLIGRQEATTHGGRVDLLAIAPDSSLVLIELKKNRTPREVVAQTLDYASWVEQLGGESIAQIYRRFSKGGSLDGAFRDRFGIELDEDTLNDSHQMIIVAAKLDDSTERIVSYLNARDIPINVVFFNVFQHGSEQLLSRAWLIDPGETQANVVSTAKEKGKKEPWNGEYYVSYGPTESRSWKDACNYGFISAGGALWYSQTLKMLSPGDRIWVKIPKSGYVGVGEVVQSVVPVGQFRVTTPEGERPALEVLEYASKYAVHADDPEKAEYFVGVRWLDTVSEADAMKEGGLFGNQNTVCQPRVPKWRHTIERLKTRLTKWQGN